MGHRPRLRRPRQGRAGRQGRVLGVALLRSRAAVRADREARQPRPVARAVRLHGDGLPLQDPRRQRRLDAGRRPRRSPRLMTGRRRTPRLEREQEPTMKTPPSRTLLALTLLATLGIASAQRTITINLVNGHAPVFLWVQQLEQTFIPTVDAALEGTDYRVEWNTFFGGTLAPVGGELEALEAGLADVGIVPTVFEPTNLPLQNVTYYLPFGTTDPFVVAEVMNGMHDDIPELVEAWEDFDLTYLGSGFSLDNYTLMTTFPVNSLDDLRGRRIGAPGAAVNWLENTGAVGVAGNLATYYNDIQTGVYD